MASRLRELLGRVSVRLLIVNLLVLLVPWVGLEFANVYERQLLRSLERDMRNQSALVRAFCEREGAGSLPPESTLVQAAKSTRTRIRVLDGEGRIVLDSHRSGPPEGEESAVSWSLPDLASVGRSGPRWPEVAERGEVRSALAGELSTTTRYRARDPGVLLFLAEPILSSGRVVGAVYVTRSTQPVLAELHKIRTELFEFQAAALVLTLSVTLLLAVSISRPIHGLVRAARRVSRGELDTQIPLLGSGEVKELSRAFSRMLQELVGKIQFAQRFAADVVHELKSPLTSIRGYAELLLDDSNMEPALRDRFLRNIISDVGRLNDLCRSLLGLAEVESLPMERRPVRLDAVVRRALSDRPNVEVRLAPVLVLGSEDALYRVVRNLVDNAVRAAPEGPVSVSTHATGQGAELVVTDGGGGISAENQKKIFDRFFTTEAARGGSGLGLSIVQSLVARHGGHVELESALGAGTTVRVWLPAST